MNGKQQAQVFIIKDHFEKVYPLGSKKNAEDSLKLFCQYFFVPEKLNFDGSKEQVCKWVTFVKDVCRQGIDYRISDPDLHNHNMVQDVIREVRRKWYCTMVKKIVPSQLWDYGVIWLSEVMSMNHSSSNSVNGFIPLTNMTRKTVDI